jgi:dipeptidyl aminopeptidase/acylaminoacyl peptidase
MSKQVRRLMNLTITAVTLLLLVMLGGLSFLAYLQASALVNPAVFEMLYSPENVGLDNYETVALETSDGLTLAAWYIPPPEPNGGAVVYLHGISARRDQLLPEARWLHELGYGALLLDLRNHGDSEGDVTTMGVTEVADVRAAVDFLLAQPDVDAGGILLLGNSFGASTALLSAADIPEVAGVVAINPYSSLRQVVSDQAWASYRIPGWPAGQLVTLFASGMSRTNLYAARPVDAAHEIAPRPIFLAHGTADETIPVISAERIAATGNHITLWIAEGVQHSSFTAQVPDEYRERLVAWVTATFA